MNKCPADVKDFTDDKKKIFKIKQRNPKIHLIGEKASLNIPAGDITLLL